MRWQGTCWLRHRGPCEAPYEWHHAVRQRLLKDVLTGADLERALGDRRWMLDTCVGHHTAITRHVLKVARDELPASVFDAAREYGVMNLIDREYGVIDDLAAAIARRTGWARRSVEGLLGQRRVRVGNAIAPYGSTVPPTGLRDVTVDGRPIL